MGKDTKDKSDKINQLKNERKPIMFLEIRQNSFDIKQINKNVLP